MNTKNKSIKYISIDLIQMRSYIRRVSQRPLGLVITRGVIIHYIECDKLHKILCVVLNVFEHEKCFMKTLCATNYIQICVILLISSSKLMFLCRTLLAFITV